MDIGELSEGKQKERETDDVTTVVYVVEVETIDKYLQFLENPCEIGWLALLTRLLLFDGIVFN